MRFTLTCCALVFSFVVHAQQERQTITEEFGGRLYAGDIVIHTQSVKNVAGVKPKGIEFEYTRMRRTGWLNENCDCYSRAGIAFTYFDYNNKILGRLFSAHYFIEPSFKITKRLFFSLKADIGISYLTNPFDSIKNPDNRNYAIRINPYMVLGAGPSFKVNDKFVVTTNASFHHISNGGIKEPNRGINWTTFSAGIRYSRSRRILSVKQLPAADTLNKKMFYQLGLFAVPQQGYNSKDMIQRKLALGILFQATKPVSKINGITAGVEMYYNKVSSTVPGREKNSRYIAGMHAGNVFLLNKVHFSQQLGFYLYNRTGYHTNLYHRWALSYFVTKKLAVGASLKAHTDNADFVDARLTYRF